MQCSIRKRCAPKLPPRKRPPQDPPAANISHDLRNPLHVILNSVEKLGDWGSRATNWGKLSELLLTCSGS